MRLVGSYYASVSRCTVHIISNAVSKFTGSATAVAPSKHHGTTASSVRDVGGFTYDTSNIRTAWRVFVS